MANNADGGGGGEEPDIVSTRVKFLCSYRGKILARHVDGTLKYVGGETRVFVVPRDITLSELMKKLSSEFDGDMVLKYQVMPDELDVLVSVKTDEELKYMFEEHYRQESKCGLKFRTFLFPADPVTLGDQTPAVVPPTIEQRYLDAINGTLRAPSSYRLPTIVANHPTFSISTCTSPKSTSPECKNITDGGHSAIHPMHKVRSSPSIASLNTQSQQQNAINLGSPKFYQHHHHYNHPYQHQNQPRPPGYFPARLPHEPVRLPQSISPGWSEFGRASPSTPTYGVNQHYACRNQMGDGEFGKYNYYNEHCTHGRRLDRADSPSLPQSPRN